MKNNMNGRSMVEMLGVLAVVGVLSVGAMAGYSKAMYKIKLNRTIEQITSIMFNIGLLFKQGDALIINEQTLQLIVPKNMWQGGKILTALKQEVNISDIQWSGVTEGKAITIEMPMMITSPRICIDLSSVNWGEVGASAYGVLLEDTLTSYGDDWTIKGELYEDAYFASEHGLGITMPVNISIASQICEKCSEDKPCTFGMFFEEELNVIP